MSNNDGMKDHDPHVSRQNAIRRGVVKLIVWVLLFFCLDRMCFDVLRVGYDRYFGFDQDNQIVFIGNSRTALGVDHKQIERLTGKKCAKFAINGATAKNRRAMTEYALSTNHACETIVYDVSGYSFNDRNLSSAAYTLLFPYLDSPSIRSHIEEASNEWSQVFIRRLVHGSRFNSTTLNLALRGWFRRDDNLKYSTVDLNAVQHRIDSGRAQSLQATEEGKKVLLDTVDLVCRRGRGGRRIVLVYLPVVKLLNDQDRAAHDRNIAVFEKLSATNPLVTFINYNKDYESRTDLMFDGLHLNAAGKKVVSARLAEDLCGGDGRTGLTKLTGWRY